MSARPSFTLFLLVIMKTQVSKLQSNIVPHLLGRKIPTQINKELMKVQTRGPLAPGIYKVKLVTKEGVFHTNLEIKP